MVKVTGRANQLRHFRRSEDNGKALPLLRIRQILFHVAALRHFDLKEAERANVQNNGIHGQLPVSEQMRVIAPEVIRPELIERFLDVSLEMLHRFGSEAAAIGLGYHFRIGMGHEFGAGFAASATPVDLAALGLPARHWQQSRTVQTSHRGPRVQTVYVCPLLGEIVENGEIAESISY